MSLKVLGRVSGVLAVALVLAALSVPGRASAQAAAPEAQPAMWTPKELRLIYQGFTTHYSCDGLRDKVRQALLQLGARADLSVQETACASSAGRPDPFPGVNIKVQVLKPWDGAAAADAQPVPAHWKSIDLKLNRDPLHEAGDCELLEQIKQTVLPLFTTRNVQYSSNCVPHQLSPGGTRLSAEVLVSDTPVAPAAPPAPAH
jgi:hypothetical protein